MRFPDWIRQSSWTTAALLPVLIGACAFFLVVVHGYLFTIGYRLSADDIGSHHLILKGISSALLEINAAAISQGRIGSYVYLPLNVIGAYFVDFFAFRVFVVGLYYTVLLLISIYVAKLVRANIALLLFVVAVRLNPLDYNHLPPNAYPLQILFRLS